MNLITRNIEEKVKTLLTLFPCVVIIGARQVGKSVLAQKICPNWQYFDMEQPADKRAVSEAPELFFQQFNKSIIFDEAQAYPELFNILRGVIDKQRRDKGRFILTGSSSPELLSEIADSLAGRVAIIELGTLKANEFYGTSLSPFYQLFNAPLTRENLPTEDMPLSLNQMQHLWFYGGYCEPLLANNNLMYRVWMENYIDTYINRDIAALFPRLNRTKFQIFVQMLAKLSSTIINKSELGRALEFNESTAREYLRIVDQTFIWRELLSFESNAIKSTVKMPKGHFRDSGLLHYLSGISQQKNLLLDPIVGRSFESFVIEELIKGLQATMTTQWSAYYYRTRGGAAIDLILKGPFGCLPVEVKYGSSTPKKALTSLEKFVIDHKLPFGLLINQSERMMWISDNIFQMPAGWL